MNSITTLIATKIFGKKVGEDSQGNIYYVKLNKKNKEKRWVIYNQDPEGSSVPPKWQAWLTGTTNVVPTKDSSYNWQIKHRTNPTGTSEAYNSTQNIFNKNFKKKHASYRSWSPNSIKEKSIENKKQKKLFPS